MKIAIIDDSASSLQHFCQLVGELTDCLPVAFTDPGEGLAWCMRNAPDLILVDYHMPQMDGLQFIAAYRTDSGHDEVPIVMISIDLEHELKHQALLLGATDFLGKPVDRVELHAKLCNLLRLRRAHLALAGRASSLADEVRAAQNRIVEREREAVLVLARAAEYRDPETGQHLVRMATYSRLIAEALDLPRSHVDLLHTAAPMHDVGKIATPDHILLKPGKLTPEEASVMQGHTVHGHNILAGSKSEVLAAAAGIALHHHERFDGTGYPHGLVGEVIPLDSRIVAVADVFDALTSVRPYKPAWSFDRARAYVEENRGAHFDPQCVDAFLSRWTTILEIAAKHSDVVSDRESARGARYMAALQASQLTAIGHLAANLAHEINTPLQYLGDNLHFVSDTLPKLFTLLQQGADLATAAAHHTDLAVTANNFKEAAKSADALGLQEEVPAAINDSIGGIACIANVVLSIMKFSQPCGSRNTSVDVNESLEDALLASRCVWKKVAEVERKYSVVPSIICHQMEIFQVFLNLIINATRAIESSGKPLSGRIVVSTSKESGNVVIRVSDTGCGIPESIRHRIFEPYFTTRPLDSNSGQGLAICRDIVVNRYGGRIDVGGKEGEGSVFIVRLPAGEVKTDANV